VQADLAGAEAGLRSRREPYARVTVVWSTSPVSTRPGDAALITGDGRLQGWIGGSCAQPIVIRQAQACLAEGAPTLLHLAPPGQLPLGREGLVVAPVTCASEGSLEVFIEPRLPSPHLVVIGSAPLVGALGVMARAVDFEVTVVERDWAKDADLGGPGLGHSHGAGWPGLRGTDERAFGGASTISELDLAKAGVGTETFVVVATMGRYDEDAVEAALATEARYVALVASDRRAVWVRELLAQGGVSQADLARVRAPAGLALGDLPHTEIAVAILAEVVAEKAKRRAGAAMPPVSTVAEPPVSTVAKPPASTVVDPVCGMTVEVAGAQDMAEHAGRTWWFCSSGCRRRFQANPEEFVSMAGRPAGKGSA